MTERIVLEPRLQCREPKAFWIVQTFLWPTGICLDKLRALRGGRIFLL